MSSSDIIEISEYFNNVSTTEDKINAVFEFNKKIIENNTSDKGFSYYLEGVYKLASNYKTYSVAIPLIIIMFLFKMLLSTYRGSVFAWGDYKEHHDELISKRKFLLSVLIGSIGTGILVNLIFFGISS